MPNSFAEDQTSCKPLYTGVPDSVPLGDAGIPEACADDAPIEGACQTCQTQANLRRWTG
jgi:hypothetical protein